MKRGSIFQQKAWIIPLGNVYFLTLLKTLIFWSIQNIKKRFSLTWLHQKNPNKKSSIFRQKPWTNPLEKCRFWHFFELQFSGLWHSLELQFSGLRIILFYPKYQKMIFTNLFSPKKVNLKKFDVWTKTMDYPLWKMSMVCIF